jgi:hypothetical protein
VESLRESGSQSGGNRCGIGGWPRKGVPNLPQESRRGGYDAALEGSTIQTRISTAWSASRRIGTL